MSEIPAEVMAVAALVIIGVISVLVPLVPTILIYRLFPNNTIMVDGPFAGLTVKATGAFAGYLIIFFLMYLKLDTIYKSVSAFEREYWTISGEMELRDAKGRKIDSEDYFRRLVVDTRPTWYSADRYGVLEVRLRLGLGETHPKIIARIDKFGQTMIDPNRESEKKDEFKKRIELKPIVIKQEVNTTSDVASSQDRPTVDTSVLPKASGF
jgi:hypothetical protein